MFPLLLVEDSDLDRVSLSKCMRRFAATTGLSPPLVTWVGDYYRGRSQIAKGSFPVVVIDFELPMFSPDIPPAERAAFLAGRPESDVELGVQLLAEVKAYNPQAVAVAFTGRERLLKNVLDYYGLADFLLEKDDLMAFQTFVERWKLVVDEVKSRFNYDRCGAPQIDAALAVAFPDMAIDVDARLQWEVCLRRSLRARPATDVEFREFSGGKSGASVVSVQFNDRRPAVLKFGPTTELQKEYDAYQVHVKDFIARNAVTDRESLYTAGDASILEYRLAGTEMPPVTLADIITGDVFDCEGRLRRFTISEIERLIEDHFTVNCRHWYSDTNAPRATDVTSPLAAHFKLSPEALSVSVEQLKQLNAFSLACNFLDIDQAEAADALVESAERQRPKVHFRRPLVRVHGDLNCNNLVWDGGGLCLIDFGMTRDEMPITTDFVRLETSIKYATGGRRGMPYSLAECAARIVRAERLLVSPQIVPTVSDDDTDGLDEAYKRRFHSVQAVRRAAVHVMRHPGGADIPTSYYQSLYVTTCKHLEYLARDVVSDDDDLAPCVVHAVASALLLLQRLEHNRR